MGFFARLMDSSTLWPYFVYSCLCLRGYPVPVSRAADSATAGTGLVRLSLDDPLLILGDGTRFLAEFTPRMQIMLPKSLNSPLAEVAEVLSDTELRIKREFGGDSGKITNKIREKVSELQREGKAGLEFKKLPFVDQQVMYRHVYECLKHGGSIGIFPEGSQWSISLTLFASNIFH